MVNANNEPTEPVAEEEATETTEPVVEEEAPKTTSRKSRKKPKFDAVQELDEALSDTRQYVFEMSVPDADARKDVKVVASSANVAAGLIGAKVTEVTVRSQTEYVNEG